MISRLRLECQCTGSGVGADAREMCLRTGDAFVRCLTHSHSECVLIFSAAPYMRSSRPALEVVSTGISGIASHYVCIVYPPLGLCDRSNTSLVLEICEAYSVSVYRTGTETEYREAVQLREALH